MSGHIEYVNHPDQDTLYTDISQIPFAIQWLWPLPILVGVIFAPESPW